jgi:hypothetical protein
VLEKPAVVAHDHERGRLGFEQRLEPEDAVEIEVVGRLVHEQQVGGAHQRLGDREPLAPAAGERRRARVGIGEPASAERRLDPGRARDLVEGLVAQRRREQGRDRLLAGRPGVLRHVGQAGQAARETVPASGVSRPASTRSSVDLPLPFGPDDADAIAVVYAERELGEERRRPERLGDRLTTEQQRHFGALARPEPRNH